MLVQIKLNPECKDGIPKIGGTLVYANQTHTINLELPGVKKAFEHYKNKGAIEVVGESKLATPKVPPAIPPQTPEKPENPDKKGNGK